MKFKKLLNVVRERRNDTRELPNVLLSLDPGETTGWALFKDLKLQECGEIPYENSMLDVVALINHLNPDVVVMEDYKVYGWKSSQHSWSDLYTVRLIGAIELTCLQNDTVLYAQMAQGVKGFCSNKKLKQWGFYKKSARHARDAVRHGCYWLMFGKKKEQ